MASMSEASSNDVSSISLVAEFQALFSSTLGTANCAPYEIEISDPTTVCSSPHRCAPPKLKIFRETIDDLLEQGVVRPSKFPHAIPAFWVPIESGRFSVGGGPSEGELEGCLRFITHADDRTSVWVCGGFFCLRPKFRILSNHLSFRSSRVLPSARHSVYMNSTSCIWEVAWVVRCSVGSWMSCLNLRVNVLNFWRMWWCIGRW